MLEQSRGAKPWRGGIVLLLFVFLSGCSGSSLDGSHTAKQVGSSSAASHTIRFAVIGDFGWDGEAEQEVAVLLGHWHPDVIITTGDNNYDKGEAETIDRNIGKYYHDYIGSYTGSFGKGAPANYFFPSLGNHDWYTSNAKPYLDYFTLPGNERYYDFVEGPVHFFALDSDQREPDGITADSTQGQWLKSRLKDATECWKIVYFHHPPYSSGEKHGCCAWMRWPFKEWGADAVLSGHEHHYERLVIDGLLYQVNGAGGKELYPFGPPVAGSQVRYCDDYGALLAEANKTRLTVQFVTRRGEVIDTYTLEKECR